MNWMEFVTRLVAELAWPLTILLLVGWFFRPRVAGRLLDHLRDRVQSLKAGPAGIEASFFQFGSSPVDSVGMSRPASKEPLTPPASGERPAWVRVANTFWLGRDLMWAADNILRGASPEIAVAGLRTSLYHLRQINLSNDSTANWLQGEIDDLSQMRPDELTQERRSLLVKQLFRVIDRIGRLAAAEQHDYTPPPDYYGLGASTMLD